jgi:hypothetical protein
MKIRRPLVAGALLVGVALLAACSKSDPTNTEFVPSETSVEASATPIVTEPAETEPAETEPAVVSFFTPIEDREVYTGDSAAKSDASYLWMVMATYYVDFTGAPPTITVEDGRYLFDGADVGWVTPGVEFGGQTGTGAEDFCVWVTNPSGTVKDYHYTATSGGYEPGPC